jgi:NitT/TauT family transport system substrate-binding protein
MPLVRARASTAASRFALVFAAAVLLSSCHALGTGGSGSAGSGTGSITVAVVGGIDNAPLLAAAGNGLFRDHGLNVTIKDESSVGQVIQALASGHADIAAGDYPDFLYDQAKGAVKLRLIADGYDAVSNSIAILTLPDSGVRTPQDLQNATVATPPQQVIPYHPLDPVPYNLETLAAEEVLQNDGVSPTSVNWKPMPAGNLIGALRSRHVKAILVTEPQIFEAETQLGAVEVVDSSSGVTAGLPLSGYFSLSSFASANPSTVQAFQAALSQAQAESGSRGPVQEMLPQITGMQSQVAALITLGTYPTVLSVGQVQRVAQLMYDSGTINDPLSVNGLVSP